VEIECTPVFEKNLAATERIVINRGGTRSSKTYSLCQLIAKWLATGHLRDNYTLENGVCRIVRKYQATLKNSVQVDWEDVLTQMELWPHLKVNKTDKTYTFIQGAYKRTVVFSGADDQQKLRGVKQDILYCNEANELNYSQEFFQLLMRTSGPIIIDFNPDDEDVWINTEMEQKRAQEKGDVEVIVSTYKDNPLLPQIMVEEIELLEKTDPAYWQIYGLGEYGKIRGLVFPEFKECVAPPKAAKFLGYGLDFGYTNDPTAVIAVFAYLDQLYLHELVYERKLTNNDIADKFELLGIDKADEIYADSAEPKSIDEIYDRGFNVYPAKKGADSIRYGIDLISQYHINITQGSHNLRKEFKHYKWLEDKDGKVLNKPIDDFNHAIDAVRYVLMSKVDRRTAKNDTAALRMAKMLKKPLIQNAYE